ncbi:MAG TPA: hypothetical protein VES67_16895 [Vicinamibacterales bacterium]|nr:hypothetical protein [Vicinamibacterales bacterium]
MRMRTLQFSAGVFITAIVLGLVAASDPTPLSAQANNPRYGKWRLKSTDPAQPSNNVMTYEPFNGTGMKITINTLQADGSLTPQWGYTTMFDGKDEPMTGSRAKDLASVKSLSDRVNEITYKRDGKITQILTNVISTDGTTLGIIYMTMDAEGKTTRVTFATYEKMQ